MSKLVTNLYSQDKQKTRLCLSQTFVLFFNQAHVSYSLFLKLNYTDSWTHVTRVQLHLNWPCLCFCSCVCVEVAKVTKLFPFLYICIQSVVALLLWEPISFALASLNLVSFKFEFKFKFKFEFEFTSFIFVSTQVYLFLFLASLFWILLFCKYYEKPLVATIAR